MVVLDSQDTEQEGHGQVQGGPGQERSQAIICGTGSTLEQNHGRTDYTRLWSTVQGSSSWSYQEIEEENKSSY